MTVNVDDTVDGDSRGQAQSSTPGFEVHLDVFEGPFDLLLALISKHKLDITEVALSQVTDEFISYIRHRSGGWDLDQVSYFLVVAAPLLDLKAARLLPSGEVEDEEDLALLEARDLLFARLLQYRAYKEAAAVFAGRMAAAARGVPPPAPAGPPSSPGSRSCCPRCCSSSARKNSRRSPPGHSRPKYRPWCRSSTSTRRSSPSGSRPCSSRSGCAAWGWRPSGSERPSGSCRPAPGCRAPRRRARGAITRSSRRSSRCLSCTGRTRSRSSRSRRLASCT